MADTMQNGIAEALRSTPAIMALLPGGVWTRKITRNENPPEIDPTPGSTPEAFDEAGRIRLCASVLNGPADRDVLGPPRAYYGFPTVFLRCLPHESEQRKLHEVARLIIDRLDGLVIEGLGGEGIVLSVAGRMMPDDDPTLPPAVVDMIRVQADSVWT